MQPPIAQAMRAISITSRDNPHVKAWRRLAQESHAWRKQGLLWLEGEHLCSVARERPVWPVQALVLSQTRWEAGEAAHWLALPPASAKAAPAEHPKPSQPPVYVLPDALFAHVSGLESPAGLAYIAQCPQAQTVRTGMATVVLDRLQDAGNVGAVLRCAAAFGFTQVVALRGSAGLFSPKVLRAGMGAHASLHLVEQAGVEEVRALNVPLLLTSSHRGQYLHRAVQEHTLPWPCAWVLGHEGQGVAPDLEALPHTPVRIAQPGGQESLNVATAAAICLHASAALALESRQERLPVKDAV